MSDSVDRVFVHALATVRRLPRTGSSRPPPSSRLRLYGLYKQSMEGDVLAILPRPTLPISSPDLNSNTNNNSAAVHRYASRDVRTREAQAEIEKWDAWHACAGMSRTDAKREYISTLIETMKEYASGTVESRELVNELEFVWSQIRSQSGSGSDPDHDDREGSPGKQGSGSGSGGFSQSPEGRKTSSTGKSRPSDTGGRRSSSQGMNRSGSGQGQIHTQPQQRQEAPGKPTRTSSGLRVLPPVSQEDSNSINSRIDAEAHQDTDDEDQENLDVNNVPDTNPHITLETLRTTLETHITALRTEIAALREQLSSNNLLSASTYTLGHHYYSLTPTQRFFHRVKLFIRTYSLVAIRQVLVQLGLLGIVVLWGRVSGDLRVEKWVQGLLSRWRGWLGRWGSWLGWWIFEVLGKVGRWGLWPLRRLRRVTIS